MDGTDDRDQYTVGWICALECEFFAATSMLDSEDPRLSYKDQNDNNTYQLGTIAGHKVVIAGLPDGQYGTTSAAVVARDLLRTFTNVRVGLMVGIGGGAPSEKHDIRLGDVVVSSRRGDQASVFQYDFGKWKTDGSFQTTGRLADPPVSVRSAITAHTARHRRTGYGLQTMIDDALKSMPKKTKAECKRPKATYDVLYKPDFEHVDEGCDDCRKCCGDAAEVILERPLKDNSDSSDQDSDESDEEPELPAVHFGPIATSNAVMKNARFRDHLSRNQGVLCFEMEAAGLMDHFPCLVIRGICDYSDSHKNKRWQGYAAMTAAAYAKSLLRCMIPSDVGSSRPIASLVQKQLQNISTEVTSIRTDLNQSALKGRREKVHKWLNPVDTQADYAKAQEQRHGSTGTWLLESAAFVEWKNTRNSFLWLYGIPGCGKTVLSSTIIRSLTEEKGPQNILYFFITFADASKQTLENLLRTLAWSLSPESSQAAGNMVELWASHDDGRRQPSLNTLRTFVTSSLAAAREMWIVIDALDERHVKDHASTGGILGWLRTISAWETNHHILVTSRNENDIRSAFTHWPCSISPVPVQGSDVASDIVDYIDSRIKAHQGLQRWRDHPDVQKEIRSVLLGKATGMFRWVALQLDTLQECVDLRGLRSTLLALPADLSQSYDRIIDRLQQRAQDWPSTLRLLQFLVYSPRPLRLDEAVDVLIVQTGDNAGINTEYRLPIAEEVISFCSSLVTIVETRWYRSRPTHKELRLSHASVQEYFTSGQLKQYMSRLFVREYALGQMAEVCLTYLASAICKSKNTAVIGKYPFIEYCGYQWTTFTRQSGNIAIQTSPAAISMFESDEKRSRWVEVSHPEKAQHWGSTEYVTTDFPPLYLAALEGLDEIVSSLLDSSHDINAVVSHEADASGPLYGTALQAACVQGHGSTAELLIDRGANVNTVGGRHGTALQAAAYHGHAHIVGLLLQHRANTEGKGGSHGSPLTEASLQGHEKVVTLLLKHGVNVNLETGFDGNALSAAVRGGHRSIVELLLRKEANVDALGGSHGTALNASIEYNHMEIMQVLLNKGASLMADKSLWDNGFPRFNAVMLAVHNMNEEALNIIINHGLKMQDLGVSFGRLLEFAVDGRARQAPKSGVLRILLVWGTQHIVKLDYGASLQLAAWSGDVHAVQTLLDHGADVHNMSAEHSTALHAAALAGNVAILELLIAAGANIHTPGREDCTALQLALYAGKREAAEYLTFHGGLFDSAHIHHVSALAFAAQRGRIGTIELLLEYGVDVYAWTHLHGNVLHQACWSGHLHVVEYLLKRGMDINSKGGYHGDALKASISRGDFSLIRYLLDRDASATQESGDFGYALTYACAKRRDDTLPMIKLLMKYGADVNAVGGEFGTALQAACFAGDLEIVQFLVQQGADINAHQGSDGSGLRNASIRGHENVVRFLLDRGAKVDIPDSTHSSALQGAASENRIRIAELLLLHGADPDHAGEKDGTALEAAAAGDSLELVRLLLDNGADVNLSYDDHYGGPLQAAIVHYNDDVAELLLERGADIERQGGWHDSPLQAALAGCNKRMTKLLLDCGASITPRGTRFGGCLPAAAFGGYTQLVKYLLVNGARINVEMGTYGTALHAAAMKGHVQVVKVLLAAGASVDIEGGFYGTALHAAIVECPESCKDDMCTLLIKNGAKVHESRAPFGTPLLAACHRGTIRLVEILLEKGADVHAVNETYGDALQIAAARGFPTVVQHLLDKGAKINTGIGMYNSALEAAAYKLNYVVVRTLLRHIDPALPIFVFDHTDLDAALELARAESKIITDRLIENCTDSKHKQKLQDERPDRKREELGSFLSSVAYSDASGGASVDIAQRPFYNI
ncbi:Ankyrin repeat-containing protein 28 [Elsinoe fawcettii]|nr:Ankyrin repeat-containing protein 28 [Elsinoe fawcettii]